MKYSHYTSFFVGMVSFLVLISVLFPERGQAGTGQVSTLNILYLGAFPGRKIDEIPPGRQALFESILKMFRSGDPEAKVYFNTLHTLPEGKTLQSEYDVRFFSDWRSKETKNRMLSHRASFDDPLENKLPIDSLALAFFTLDDTILLTETTSRGFTKVSVYVLASFFVFDFHYEYIIYTNQFLVPLNGDTRREDTLGYAIDIVTNEIAQNGFKNLLKSITKKSLKGNQFKEIMEKRKKGQLGVAYKEYAAVRTAKNLYAQVETDVPKRYQARIKEEISFRQLAAYLATIRFSKEIPMIPSSAKDSSLPGQNERLKNIIINAREDIERITGFSIHMEADSRLLRSADKEFFLPSNLFPDINYLIDVDVDVNQLTESDLGYRRKDRITALANINFSTFFDKDVVLICPKNNQAPLSLSYSVLHEYNTGEAVKMSDAYFYNAMFLALVKDKKNLRLFDEQNGIYGPLDSVEACQ